MKFFVTAAMCFAMDLMVTAEAMDSISTISESYSRLAIIVNDIYSFERIPGLECESERGGTDLSIL